MNGPTLINLTTHNVNILLTDINDIAFNCGNEWLTIPQSGTVARCDTEYETRDQITVDNNYREESVTVNIRERYFNEPYAFNKSIGDTPKGRLPFPALRDGVLYIVSRIVAEACANVRSDLLMIDGSIKEENRIIGCEALARWPVDKEVYDCGCINHGDDECVGCETCGHQSCLDCHHINSQGPLKTWKCYEGYGCNKSTEEENKEE